jgi:hypothetical protein
MDSYQIVLFNANFGIIKKKSIGKYMLFIFFWIKISLRIETHYAKLVL